MKSIKLLLLMLLALGGTWAHAQNDNCSGTWTEAAEGTFTDGFTYQFTLTGGNLLLEVELLDPKDGLVAFAQTYNPNFAEVPMDNAGGQAFSRVFTGQTVGSTFNVAVKFAFAGGLVTSTQIAHTVSADCAGTVTPGGIVFPITFEDEDIDYGLTDFGGNVSIIVADPTDASNTVVQSTKTDGAPDWSGTTVGQGVGFADPIPFSADLTTMTVRVWSPNAGTVVRLKAEALTDPTVSVETDAVTTEAATWETLTFDFANQAPGTAALNFGSVYRKASIFFAFGTPGNDLTYYWDDVNMGESAPPADGLNLPITFEDDIDYMLTDFGGNASEIVPDPTDPSNTVVETTKTVGAELWAGTTVGGTVGFENPIPFAPGSTEMTVRVWSPTAGTPVRLKVEQAGNGAISVETQVNTTVAMEWETLTFDFANQVEGPAINFSSTYNLASIFFNFGTTGAVAGEQTYYWDDLEFGEGSVQPSEGIELPITFEEDIDYGLVDFGDNMSEIVVDPTDASNMVVQTIKPTSAPEWAGTTVAEGIGFSQPLPFEPDATTMTVRVWSPLAGIPIRLKVENLTDPTISVETEATITEAEVWQTLTFDFANQADGTAAINFSSIYTKASIFFNFGTTGADSGEQTYYWDDVTFGEGSVTPPASPLELPITFEEDIDYSLVDFGGNASEIVVDPTDANNMVVQSIKGEGAQTWAGTTVGEFIGFAEPLPFEEGATTMTVRVWSPLAGIPIRLKVENLTDPTISVETEAVITTAEVWETLTFDFANEATGTAAINFSSIYTKASIFFNFDTPGSATGEQTYYWDDVTFGEGATPPTTVYSIIANSPDHTTLKSLIDLAELDGALMGEGPFTVFAPTDEAFAALPAELVAQLTDDPTGLLADVLLYHVLGAQVLSTDLSDGQEAATLQGEDITVSIEGTVVMINAATVTAADLMADNGVVHVLNGVMLPPSFSINTVNSLKDLGITVFPNPTADYVQISFAEAPSQNTVLTMFNLNGKVVKQANFSGQDQRFAVGELPAGTYLLRISNENGFGFHKLMIAK